MLEKVKRIPNYLLKRKVFLGASILGILLTPTIVRAISFRDFSETWVLYLLSVVLRMIIWLTKFLTEFAGGLLNWIISPGAISLDYTNPSGNPIIEVGLGITQGFANIFLVLVLLYIAIATILRLQEYQAQKLLPIFILVALLVNFAPVVAGVVVDASNIVMGFFVSSLSPDEFSIFMSNKMDHLISAISEAKTSEEIRDPFVQMVMIAIIINVLTMVFILYFFLFLARYIAIWMLVILSPLAFVALILPNTRNYFKEWWKQLINWSFVGAIGGFFMYLSLSMVVLIQANPGDTVQMEQLGFFNLNAVLPYIVPIAFLLAGFIYTLKGAAAGSSIAIGMAQGINKKYLGGAKWLAKSPLRGARFVAKKTYDRAKERARDSKIIPKIFKSKKEREQFDKDNSKKSKYNLRRFLGGRHFVSPREKAESTSRFLDSIPGVRVFTPDRLKDFSEYKEAMDQEGETTGPSHLNVERVANGKFIKMKAAKTIYDTVVTRGDSQDIIKTYAKKLGHIDRNGKINEKALLKDPQFRKDKRLNSVMEIIKKAGKEGEFLKNDPRLSMIGRSEEDGFKKMTEIVNDTKAKHSNNWEGETADNIEIAERSMAIKDEGHFRSIAGLKGGGMERQKANDTAYSEWADVNIKDKSQRGSIGSREQYMQYLATKFKVEEAGIVKIIQNKNMRSKGFGYREMKDKKEIFIAVQYKEEKNRTGHEEMPGESMGMDIPPSETPTEKEKTKTTPEVQNVTVKRTRTRQEKTRNIQGKAQKRYDSQQKRFK